jgi:uracil phosphoribosyltransferase
MFILNAQNSIANQFLAEMRDITVQNDSMRFRKNMERLGEILAYEISKTLDYQPATVQTPLAEASTALLTEQPVLVAILRASLPFYQGFLNLFDQSENAFIGAYRGKHRADETLIFRWIIWLVRHWKAKPSCSLTQCLLQVNLW